MTGTPSPTDNSTAARRALEYLQNNNLRGALARITSTGMSTLLGAVQRAGSMEEIEILVRYQQARSKNRDQGSWDKDLIEQLIKDLTAAASEGGDRARAAAAQLGLIARIHRVVADGDGGRGGAERGGAGPHRDDGGRGGDAPRRGPAGGGPAPERNRGYK